MGVAAAAPVDLVLLLGSLVGRTAAAAVYGGVGDGIGAATDDQLAVQEEAEVVLSGGAVKSTVRARGGGCFPEGSSREGRQPCGEPPDSPPILSPPIHSPLAP